MDLGGTICELFVIFMLGQSSSSEVLPAMCAPKPPSKALYPQSEGVICDEVGSMICDEGKLPKLNGDVDLMCRRQE